MEIREYISYILTPEAEVDSSVIERVGGVGNSRAAVSGAFAVAVERRFEKPPSREDVAALVARVRGQYVRAEGLPPMLGEAVVRAAYGEEHLVDELSGEEYTRGQLLMTYGIVHDLGLKDEQFDAFLDEATEVANEIIEQAKNRSS